MKSFFNRVQTFTKAANDTPDAPVKMSLEAWNFLKKMIQDEISEVDKAFEDYHNVVDNNPTDQEYTKALETLMVEQADVLIDISYYCFDAGVKVGYDLDPLIDIVCEANLSKLKDGKVIKDTDPQSPRFGKILKPEGWKDPMPLLASEIRQQTKKGFSATNFSFDPNAKISDIIKPI